MSDNTIHRALVEKLGGRNVSEFVGNAGDLFWDPDTGNLRISDGETVGGLSVAESSPWAEDIFVGPWVNFVRPADSPETVDVIIPGLLTIARDPSGEGGGSIYNAVEDEGGGVDTPTYTSWNTDGWGDLTNIKTRYYEDLNDANTDGGYMNPHFEWVMKVSGYEGPERYFLVRFLNWDSGGVDDANGAFAWTRREINANAFFSRVDTNDEEEAFLSGDEIADHLILTRENGGFLFNYGIVPDSEGEHWEENYDEDRSPYNTLWNWDGWDNLQNLKSRQFMLFGDLVYSERWYGQQIVGREFIMHDTFADEYYAIKFTRWNNANNYTYPGFAYIRRKIDLEKLSHGLTFEDGTSQRTAYSTKVGGTIPQAPYITAQIDGTRWINSDDIGKMIILDSDTTDSVGIPETSTLQWPIGGVVTIVNMTPGTVSIFKDNDEENGTIYGAGTSDSATSWDLPNNGGGNVATLMKIKQGMDGYFNDYILVGSGITVD